MFNFIEAIVVANLMLVVGCLIMWMFELAGRYTPFRHAYRLRLNLAIAAVCATTLPIVLAPLSGALSTLLSVNVDDIFIAQYLKGNVSLSATQVSDVLSVKDNFIDYIVNPGSIVSYCLIGAFVIAAFSRAIYIIINIIRAAKLIESADQMKNTKRISVRISEDTETPFSTRCLFKYYVVLPAAIKSDKKTMNIAMGHEAQHIRQQDVTWEIFVTLLSPLFVLNPAFWVISDRVRRFREYSCDTAYLDKARCKKRDYCMLLLDTAERAARQKEVAMAGSVPFWGREGTFSRKRQPKHILKTILEKLP